MLLWEDEGIVWVRATTPSVGIPTTATPITDVWDDTGIVPPVPSTGLPVSDKVLAVREGLSPLAIKRSPAILQKAENHRKSYRDTSCFRESGASSWTYGFRDGRGEAL